MLSVEGAQHRILQLVEPLPSESIAVGQALGRVLVEPFVARMDLPPADNSAMDGYAVRWEDVAGTADGGEPVLLRVAETIPAGGWSERRLLRGEAARIFTGAPLPPGADLVVMQEWTEASDEGRAVRILRCGPSPGHHVRRAGEDIRLASTCVAAGDVLGAADLALIASQGATELECHRRPVVSIVSTGDEVHEPGEPLPPGHIWSGNSVALEALIRQAGGVPRYLGIARDNLDSLREVFGRVAGSDAIVSIGGVSVGEYDLVRDVLSELGEQHFWRVAMRPGKPNACGTIGGIPYFGLPGNPVSCMVSFLQYVRPALRKQQGCRDLFLPTLAAFLDEGITSREGFLFFYRGVMYFDWERSCFRVRTTGPQGSGIMSSMAEANCLIVVPEDKGSVEAGAVVRVQLLSEGPSQPEPMLR